MEEELKLLLNLEGTKVFVYNYDIFVHLDNYLEDEIYEDEWAPASMFSKYIKENPDKLIFVPEEIINYGIGHIKTNEKQISSAKEMLKLDTTDEKTKSLCNEMIGLCKRSIEIETKKIESLTGIRISSIE